MFYVFDFIVSYIVCLGMFVCVCVFVWWGAVGFILNQRVGFRSEGHGYMSRYP